MWLYIVKHWITSNFAHHMVVWNILASTSCARFVDWFNDHRLIDMIEHSIGKLDWLIMIYRITLHFIQYRITFHTFYIWMISIDGIMMINGLFETVFSMQFVRDIRSDLVLLQLPWWLFGRCWIQSNKHTSNAMQMASFKGYENQPIINRLSFSLTFNRDVIAYH